MCKSGFYRDGANCAPCNIYCSRCTGPTNNDCLPNECRNNAYPLESSRTTCLYFCMSREDDLYLDEKEGVCKQCTPPCASCPKGHPELCTSCKTGLLYEGKCIDECPKGYYSEIDVCLPCHPKCKHCIDRFDHCVEGCNAPYVYRNNRCYLDCEEGSVLVGNTCKSCNITGCLKCSYKDSRTTCLECSADRVLNKGKCLTACSDGYYLDLIMDKCVLCHEACSRCFGPTNRDCYSCRTDLGYIRTLKNVCVLPSCVEKFYFNKTMRRCNSCPENCLECLGAQNCIECDRGYVLDPVKKKCYDPCDTPGFIRKAGSFGCKEICGDGINMGQYECDDGNLRNGDGCSSKCKIESGFKCTNNENLTSVCVDKSSPYATLSLSGENMLIVKFNKLTRVKVDSNTLTSQMEVTVNVKCKLSWSLDRIFKANSTITQLRIFVFPESILKRQKVIFTVQFKNTALLTNLDNIPLFTSTLKTKSMQLSYLSKNIRAATKVVGMVFVSFSVASLLLMLAAILFHLVAIESFWSFVNMVQVLSYLPILNLDIPANLEIFLTEYLSIGELVMPFDIFPDFPLNPAKFAELFISESFSEKFSIAGYKSFNFLYAFYEELFTWILMGVGYIALRFLCCIFRGSKYFLV